MIKWIKSLIKKVFGKKEEPKPEAIKETVVAEPEKIQCNTHSRFKKSCPICNGAAK